MQMNTCNMQEASRTRTGRGRSTTTSNMKTPSIRAYLAPSILILLLVFTKLSHTSTYNETLAAAEVVATDEGPHFEPLVQPELLSAPPLDTGSQPAPASSAPGRPGKRTAYACEEKQLQIECQLDESIRLIRAIYGRFSIQICNDHGQVDWKVNCMSPSSSSIIKNSCQDQQSCHLLASSSVFGDPCPGTQKYLEVHYECVPARNHTVVEQAVDAAGAPAVSNRPLLPVAMRPQPTSKLDVIQQQQAAASMRDAHSRLDTSAGPQPPFGAGGRPLVPASSTQSTLDQAPAHQQFQWMPSWMPNNHPLPAAAGPGTSASRPTLATCPETTRRQIRWPATEPGLTVQMPCPGHAISDNPYDTYMASLTCSSQARWLGHVQAAHCQSLWLRNLTQRLDMGDSLFGLLEELVHRTRVERAPSPLGLLYLPTVAVAHSTPTGGLFGDDLLQIERVLSRLADDLPELLQRIADDRQRFGYASDFLQRLVDLISNLAHEHHSEAWTDLGPVERRRTASRLLQSVEVHGALVASMAPGPALTSQQQQQTTDGQPVFSRVTENNYLFVHLVPVQNHSLDLSLPQSVELLGTPWMKDDEWFSLHLKTGDSSQASPDATQDSQQQQQPMTPTAPGPQSLRVVFAILKGLATHLEPLELAAKTANGRLQVNSHLASLSILGDSHTPSVQLSAPFQLVLRHLHQAPSAGAATNQPICAFWDTNSSDWQTVGCSLVATNRTHSTCACNHLTSFALLSEIDTQIVANQQQQQQSTSGGGHFSLDSQHTPVQLDTFQDGPILLANGRLLYVDKLLNGHLFTSTSTSTSNGPSLINGRFLIYLSCLVSAAVYAIHLLAVAYNRSQTRRLLNSMPSHPAPPLLVTVRNSQQQLGVGPQQQQSPTYTHSTSSGDYSAAAATKSSQLLGVKLASGHLAASSCDDAGLLRVPSLRLPVHLIIQLMALYLLVVVLVESQEYLATQRLNEEPLPPVGLVSWCLVLALYYLLCSVTCWLAGQLVCLDLSLMRVGQWWWLHNGHQLHSTSGSGSSASSETKSSWIASHSLAAPSSNNPTTVLQSVYGAQSANFYGALYGANQTSAAANRSAARNPKQNQQQQQQHQELLQSSISPSSSYASSSMGHSSEQHQQAAAAASATLSRLEADSSLGPVHARAPLHFYGRQQPASAGSKATSKRLTSAPLLDTLARHANLIRLALVHGLPVLLVALVGWLSLPQSSLINEHFYTLARLNQVAYWPLLVDACSRSLAVLLYYAPMVCLALIACALFALKRWSSQAAATRQASSHLNPYGDDTGTPAHHQQPLVDGQLQQQQQQQQLGASHFGASNQFMVAAGGEQPLSKQLGNSSRHQANLSPALNHWQMEQARKAKTLCLSLLTLLALHTLSWISFFAHLQQSLAGQARIEQLLYVFALSNLLLTGFLSWFQRHSVRRAAQLAGLGRLFGVCCGSPRGLHPAAAHSIYGHATDTASGASSKSNHHLTGGGAVKVSPSSQSLFLISSAHHQHQQQQQAQQLHQQRTTCNGLPTSGGPPTVYQVNSYQCGPGAAGMASAGPLSARHLYQQLSSPQHIYDSATGELQQPQFPSFEANNHNNFQLAAHLNRSMNSLNQIHLQHSGNSHWPTGTSARAHPMTLKPHPQPPSHPPQLLVPENLEQQQQHLFSAACIQQQSNQDNRRTQGISGEAEGPLVAFSSSSSSNPPATFGPHSSTLTASAAPTTYQQQQQHHHHQQLAIEHQRFSSVPVEPQSGAPQELRAKSPGGDHLRYAPTSGGAANATHHHHQQQHQYYSINNQRTAAPSNYTDALKAAMIEQQQQNESSVAQHFRRANSKQGPLKHQRQLAELRGPLSQQQQQLAAPIYDVANYGGP